MAKLKLNPKMIERITELIKNSCYLKTAIEAVGISQNAYFRWNKMGREIIEKGKTPKTEQEKLYCEFYLAIKKAEIEAEEQLLKTIKFHAIKNWTAAAWLLERKYPEKWGRKERIEVSTTDNKTNEKVRSVIDVLQSMTDTDYEHVEKHIKH